jgi:signal transduction histidine kinase
MEERQVIILNVDDKEPARYAKTRGLRHAGFTVAEAATGYEALQKAEELQPAVVVLDIKLPDISGLQVCAVIKRRWPRIMVLQTSATFVSGEDRSRGLEGGADSYLTQPIEPRELVAAVNALLRLSEVEDKLRRLNETLEQRVEERTRDLAIANEQLRQEIAQRKRAEAALVQAQKMEAIGHLTGGIAHDFNNLLTAVVGNLDRIRSRSADPKIVRLAEHAFRAADRGSKLTAQLLAFSRTQKLIAQPVDLNSMFEGMIDLLQQSLGPSIHLDIQIDSDLPSVLADPNQLELAILNLVINARDAIERPDGRIRVEATRTVQTEVANELAAGEYVIVAVSDNGSGMSQDVILRAFDPFFTTKPAGKGTGLGLSQVYGIARQAGGAVRIASELGKGTTVSIFLKPTTQAIASDEPASDVAPGSHSEGIMIIDDDHDVRTLVEDFLSEIGYRTCVANDGDAALAMLEQFQPDLVLADFAMPGSNGAEVAMQIRERLPDLPILFFSGYADTSALEEAVGKTPLLRKPFRPAELAAVIRELLDGRSSQG